MQPAPQATTYNPPAGAPLDELDEPGIPESVLQAEIDGFFDLPPAALQRLLVAHAKEYGPSDYSTWAESEKERRRAYNRDWRERHPESRSHNRDRMRNIRARNRVHRGDHDND